MDDAGNATAAADLGLGERLPMLAVLVAYLLVEPDKDDNVQNKSRFLLFFPHIGAAADPVLLPTRSITCLSSSTSTRSIVAVHTPSIYSIDMDLKSTTCSTCRTKHPRRSKYKPLFYSSNTAKCLDISPSTHNLGFFVLLLTHCRASAMRVILGLIVEVQTTKIGTIYP